MTAPAARPRARGRAGQANDAWESLLQAHAQVMRGFAAEDTWREVSMREYDVLYALSKCDVPQRIGELGRHVLLSQPALSRMVDRLEARGLVVRTQDPDDARSVRIGLTQAGLDAQRTVGRSHGLSVAAVMTAALTPAEMDQLTIITRKLQEAAS
jgi:DNA-binding MarR family transcriptional regulator